ncbi:MAG: hypothetical protein K2P84_00910, partial [Undibacterium sp.]|nr:hypothetical protein [Undibacterium sp.]
FVGARWGWVPGRFEHHYHPVYAPHLVAFIGLGNGGLSASVSLNSRHQGGSISWFPLGPREIYRPFYPHNPRYLQNLNQTIVNNHTTIINNNVYVNRDVRNAVTSVSTQTFTRGEHVFPASHSVLSGQIRQLHVATEAPALTPERSNRFGDNRSSLRQDQRDYRNANTSQAPVNNGMITPTPNRPEYSVKNRREPGAVIRAEAAPRHPEDPRSNRIDPATATRVDNAMPSRPEQRNTMPGNANNLATPSNVQATTSPPVSQRTDESTGGVYQPRFENRRERVNPATLSPTPMPSNSTATPNTTQQVAPTMPRPQERREIMSDRPNAFERGDRGERGERGERFHERTQATQREMPQQTRIEAPRVETPRIETPRMESPKMETRRMETPRVETPRVEAPRVEVPRPTPPAESKASAPVKSEKSEKEKDHNRRQFEQR